MDPQIAVNNTLQATATYIKMSKTNIDKYISNNEYKKAFALTILVLERINADEKVEFIDYYSKQLTSIISGNV